MLKEWKVYRRREYETRWGSFIIQLQPVMTVTACTPEHALRIAKQKGEVAPIIGPAKEEPLAECL